MFESSKTEQFGARLSKEDFKFSAAHFTLFGPQEAEALHGHNYQVAVSFVGSELDQLGFLADFAQIKSAIRGLCDAWDEKTLLPSESEFVQLSRNDSEVEVRYGSRRYTLPADETELLPVSNITVEELSRLFWNALVSSRCFSTTMVESVTVEVSETSGQCAWYQDLVTR